MRRFFHHLQVRLLLVARSPMALLMVLFLGLAGGMTWLVFQPAPMSDLGPGFDLFLRTLLIWMLPFMAAFFITGRLWSLGEGAGLGTAILPVLPISPRTRIAAETAGGVLLLAIPRFLIIPLVDAFTGPDSGLRAALVGDSPAGEMLIGTLVLLPVLTACVAPTRREWFSWVRSLAVAVVMAGLVQWGITASPVLTAAAGLGMSAWVLFLYRLEPDFDPADLGWRNGASRMVRTGMDPEVRFRDDLWRLPLKKFRWVLIAMLLITFVSPPMVAAFGIPEPFYALTAGVLPGLAIFLLMYPLGIHLFNGDRGFNKFSGNAGTFRQAWSRLPLPSYRVMRGIWLHGMVGGLFCWALFLTHFILMMAFSGEWTRLVWFHASLALAIPAMAGFLVAGAAGDGFRLTLSMAALIAIPAVDVGLTLGLKSAGFPLSQSQQILVVFAAALAATLVGGLPPLVHLRRPS